MKLNRCHSGGHSIQQVWFNSSGTVPEMTDDSKDTRTAQNTNLHYTIQIKGFCVEDQPQERNKSGIDMFITGWIRAQLVIQQARAWRRSAAAGETEQSAAHCDGPSSRAIGERQAMSGHA